MANPMLFVGQEFSDVTLIGQAYGGGFSIDSTAGHFAAGFARYGMKMNTSSISAGANTAYIQIPPGSFASSSFWFTCQMYLSQGFNSASSNVFVFLDASGLPRLQIQIQGASGDPPAWTTGAVQTVNALGGTTQLGTFSWSPAQSALIKFDVFINYSTSGQISFYQNSGAGTASNLLYAYSGDVTTNGVTSLGGVNIGGFGNSGGPLSPTISGILVSTRDTRNMSLWTQAPLALGVTDTFTGGAVSNVNGNMPNFASPDYSATAGQRQLYTGGAPPSGNFSVITVQQTGIVTIGDSGPQHVEFDVRTGGTVYTGGTLSPGLAWGRLTYDWDTNPNTGVAWTTADLAAAGFNLGYDSVT